MLKSWWTTFKTAAWSGTGAAYYGTDFVILNEHFLKNWCNSILENWDDMPKVTACRQNFHFYWWIGISTSNVIPFFSWYFSLFLEFLYMCKHTISQKQFRQTNSVKNVLLKTVKIEIPTSSECGPSNMTTER